MSFGGDSVRSNNAHRDLIYEFFKKNFALNK